MGFVEVVALLNSAFAGLAFVMSLAAARRGSLYHRWVFAAIAPLAAVYSASYGWLLFNLEHASTWSSVMRGVSLVAWPVAWWLPARVSIQRHEREMAELRDRVLRLREELNQ